MTRSQRNQLAFTAALSLLVLASGCDKKDETAAEPAPAASQSPTAKAPESPAGGSTPAATGSATEAPTLADVAGSYTIDPVHSAVVFRVKHLGVSYTHGRFNRVSGEITLGATPASSGVELTVDANSVFTADKKRDQHLRGPDFFNSKQFPTISFTSKEIVAAGPGVYEVSGELVLRGITKRVSVRLEHVGATLSPLDNKSFLTGFEGELTIKRSDFGLNYMPGGIGEDVDLTIAIEAVKKS